MENKKSLGAQNEGPHMPVGRWVINEDKCNGCGECVDACSIGLLYIFQKKVVIRDEKRCTECEDCASVCAYRAIKFL